LLTTELFHQISTRKAKGKKRTQTILKKQKSLLKITENREPRATKQSIISNTIENRSIPPATTVIMTHSNILR
jgi:hypothetical protein